MRRLLVALLLLVAVFVGLVKAGEYGVGPFVITREDERKLVLLLDTAPDAATEPGLSARLGIPVLERVLTFDRRWLHLNSKPRTIQTIDRERIVVDNYVIWRIADALQYYRSFRGDQGKAEERIERIVGANVREVVGKHSIPEVLTEDRDEIMSEITDKTAAGLERFGIEVKDVRINRTELPTGTEGNVYARMRAERERLARKQRAEGEEAARAIRAEADRAALVTVARAREEAERLRGKGDAEATRIYAEAYSEDEEFYVFLRSLEAYRKTLGKGTTVVLPPSHEFFRLFQEGAGLPEVGAPAPAVEGEGP